MWDVAGGVDRRALEIVDENVRGKDVGFGEERLTVIRVVDSGCWKEQDVVPLAGLLHAGQQVRQLELHQSTLTRRDIKTGTVATRYQTRGIFIQ